jgi:hypothetical protein
MPLPRTPVNKGKKVRAEALLCASALTLAGSVSSVVEIHEVV